MTLPSVRVLEASTGKRVNNLYWLDRIQPSQRTLVGEKAFVLSRLQQAGYRVVPGAVLGTSTLQRILERVHEREPLLPDAFRLSRDLDVEDESQLQSLAGQMRQVLQNVQLPENVESDLAAAARTWHASTLIVRPSPFVPGHPQERISGLLGSCLCRPETGAIAPALEKVWARLYSATSLFYWQRLGIALESIALAVLVQPAADAIASGTLELAATEWQVRSAWGLGYGIVRGEVQPDCYRFDPGDGTLSEAIAGSKSLAYCLDPDSATGWQVRPLDEEQQGQDSLDEDSLSQLSAIASRLQSDYRTRLRCEWVLCQLPGDDAPRIYLTQLDLLTDRHAPESHAVRHSQRDWGDRPAVGHPLEAREPSLAVLTAPEPSPRHVPETSDRPEVLPGMGAAPGRASAPAHLVVGDTGTLDEIPGRILVARDASPDWFPWLKHAAGIVVEEGGMTSHAAILAREIGIPAVVGVVDATRLLAEWEMLTLDGDRGEVYRHGRRAAPARPSAKRPTHLETPFREPIATQLLVNLSQRSAIETASRLPVDGVGLVRSELMLLDLLAVRPLREWLQPERLPQFVEQLTEAIAQFASGFAPRPVFYRSTDWLSVAAKGTGAVGGHPLLGRRGTYGYLLDARLFEAELAALAAVQRRGQKNVNLILPFVRSLREFEFCQQRVAAAGVERPPLQLWMMAEVPSVLFLLPEYARAGVEGIAIGTNDLAQLLLGVDRDRAEVAALLDEEHPAMAAALASLIRQAKELGIPRTICGQAPVQFPSLVERLVSWGITGISVEMDAVESTYRAIARAERRLLLEGARQ